MSLSSSTLVAGNLMAFVGSAVLGISNTDHVSTQACPSSAWVWAAGERVYAGLTSAIPAGSNLYPAPTAVSEHVVLPARPDLAEDTIVSSLQVLARLPSGWDGEDAESPKVGAIQDAIRFVRSAGRLASDLHATLHVDGSVNLEIGDGSDGLLEFTGNRRVAYAVKGVRPGVADITQPLAPELVAALSA